MHQVYMFKLTGAGALSITRPSEARGAVVSIRMDGGTEVNIFAVDGIVLDPFRDSEEDSSEIPPEDLERAWDMRKECCEPRGCQDYSGDAQTLATAQWVTDEDCFFGSCE